MKNSIFKRTPSLFMAMLLAFSGLATTAFAAGERSEIYMVSFPRDAEANKANWDRDNLQFMNGWHMDAYDMFGTFAVGSYDGKIAYCIEPGVPIDNGHSFTAKDETFWDNYPSAYNKTIDRDTIKSLIGRILQYGYNGSIDPNWVSQNAAGAEKLAHVYATQLLIWETIVGERDENFGHVSTGGKNAVLDFVKPGHPLRGKIMDKYNSMVTSVQNHSKVPSFMAKSKGKAATVELEWNGTQYTATLTDTNKVLGNYNFSSDYAGLKFTTSGNTLTITSPTAPTGEVAIRANKKDSKRMGLVVWDDGAFGPNGGQQDTVTYTQSVSDPIAAYLKLKVSYGSVEIVKTSEDGTVDGLDFRVQGDNVDDIFTTADGGHIQIENLTPGVYTVTEQSADEYNPQDSQEVTVVAGQTATVTFNNTLRRGDLTVTKTAEDWLTEGMKFHLYGTSLSGLAVDEYATVGADGKAYFKNILIGTSYTLEEVDTPERYVVPASQTAAVEWNTVTEKFFDNRLKKWNLTVTKQDGENGAPQGNASLAGAVYGVYNGEELVDTYTTDAEGKFTTQYYPCGDNWSLREIEPSEGYLLDESAHHIGAETKNYEVEYSAITDTVDETVKKGNISIIKHTDNGDTQLETPEAGAEFEVFLKSSGSYDVAKDTERDHLVCDENGFAQTKMLPYGIYTVHQTKGWDGRELLADFDVYISEDGQTYRYLANNANFKSFIKITKVDAETGKTIPYAGAGFQFYRPDGSLITQSFTYPTPTTIDTFYTNDEGWLLTPETLEYGTGYANTEAKKKELFARVRSGQVRILMGSTQKMGAGTNVQDRLIALHDVDCPWRPSDLSQRLGRIVRQGNQNPEVEIYRYVTENTFDAYLYQLVENKQKFIAQIMTSKAPVRAAEDVDETALSYSEIKALATGNPLIIEKCNLDMEVSKLNMLKASYLSQKYAMEDMVLRKYPESITRLKERIAGYEEDIRLVDAHPKPQEGFVGIVIDGKTITDKETAGKAILDVCTKMTGSDAVAMGEYRGFSLAVTYNGTSNEYRMSMRGTLTHTITLGADVFGNITRMDNMLDSLATKQTVAREELADTEKQLASAREEMDSPFANEDELAQKSARLKELNILLNMDQKDRSIMDDGPEEEVSEKVRVREYAR